MSIQGRSLEEVDELFKAGLAAWRFKGHHTHGTAGFLTAMENGDRSAAADEKRIGDGDGDLSDREIEEAKGRDVRVQAGNVL